MLVNRLLFALCVLWLPLSAVEGDGATQAAQEFEPALVTVSAGKGATISFSDQEPSKLLGGVKIGYELAEVLCDHVHYWQSPLAGSKRSVLDHALFETGPDAYDPEHVIFDTRRSHLPGLSFRGLMTPARVEAVRQPLEPEPDNLKDFETPRLGFWRALPPNLWPPRQAVFRVQLHALGDFSGDLFTASGWAPYAGWADETEMIIVADITPIGLANARFRTIVLDGRAERDGQPKKGAKLQRLKQSVPDAKQVLKSELIDWWIQSSLLTIEFTPAGRLLRIETGHDTDGSGTPSLDTPIEPGKAAKPGKSLGKPAAVRKP